MTAPGDATTVGSILDPVVTGRPATAMQSLTPTVLPARGPLGAPRTSQNRMKALKGSSPWRGARPGSR